jgi:hypothetical protein
MSDILYEVEINKSQTAIDNVCTTKKICKKQGPITFGQLRELVESGKIQRIATHVGEGGYKAILRLVPWFLPQLVLLGFGATWIRVINKLFRPTLEETTNYKTWWGKTILKIFDLVEGELNATDPLSKIFFISDGLMTMLNDKYKVEFAGYISEVADEQPDNEVVPEYFVENELRNWLNDKFFLDPPLQLKNYKEPSKSISESNMNTKKTFEIKKGNINEISKRRSIIRGLVSDVVTIYKENEEGEFYLPEDLDGSHSYIFPKLKNPLQVELTIFPDDEVNDFLIDADYFDEESIIAITIVYDPEKKLKLLYDIVGELNEIIAHEIRHIDQHRQNMYDIDYDKIEKIESDPIKYYTQPHELDAQVYGFKRLSKLRNKPFEQVVRNWFETHKDIHGMEENEYQFIIDKIIEEKKKN